MSVLKWMVSVALLLVLAACGGGGGSAGDTPLDPGNGDPGPTVSSLNVFITPGTIANTGTGSVTATITALDANRNAVPGAAVTVSASEPAIAVVQGTDGSVTNSSGQVLVTLTVPPGSTNGDVTITAKADGVADASAVLRIIDSPSGATPASVEVLSASTVVGTGGDTVQLTAFVKDANNNALPGTSVAFATSTGTLSSVSASTDTAGAATATFSAGADKSNRSATIRVTAGTISGTVTLPITGTSIKVSGPSSLVFGNQATFDVVVTDSKSNVLPNIAVTAVSSLGNTLQPVDPSGLTDANGQLSFTYTASKAGTDTLSFAGGGASATPPSVTISGEDFAFTSPAASSELKVGASKQVKVRLLKGSAPQSGVTVSFASTGGTLKPSKAVTDANGVATVSISSSSAGPLTVQATATVDGSDVSATLPLTVVATNPAKLVLQINPTAVAPTSGTAQVIAKVTDAADNPVSGVTVNFTRVTDPSGGNLLQASATTDSNGQANVTYKAGDQSTADKGVVLKATVASKTSVSSTATLTVNRTSLFIALGTGNEIIPLDSTTYQKDWVTYVTDSNSVPVTGASLTIKAIPNNYLVGQLVFNSDTNLWVYSSPIYSCRNEDRDGDGKLRAKSTATVTGVVTGSTTTITAPGHKVQAGDRVKVTGTGGATALSGLYLVSSVDDSGFVIPLTTTGASYSASEVSFVGYGEDDNDDGVLWPGNVISVAQGNVQTVDGRATLSLIYAESYVPWVDLRLTASATVTGTESSTFADFTVPGLSDDFTSEAKPPAGRYSPFGKTTKTGAVCTVVN